MIVDSVDRGGDATLTIEEPLSVPAKTNPIITKPVPTIDGTITEDGRTRPKGP